MRLILACLLAVISEMTTLSAQTALDSSEEARVGKTFGIGLGFGLFVTPVFGSGLTAHYFLSESMHIEVARWGGTWDGKDLLASSSTTVINRFDINAKVLQARLKYFTGNSFYFAGGLGTRHIEFDLEASDSASRIANHLEASTIAFNIAIGNTWSFESGFYIGGEWLAASIPMTSSVKSSLTTQGAVSEGHADLEESSQKSADSLAKATTMGLLMLQLGWQF